MRDLPNALAIGLVAAGCSTPTSLHPPVCQEWAGTHATAAGTPPAPALPPDAWVLHVGDSFVEASFHQNLEPLFRGAGSRYVVHSETATYTTTWAYDAELEQWLSRRPALVLVTLGANEVDMPLPETHAHAVESIARKVAAVGAQCVWITPPLWKRETGIVEVIHDHCAPCLFFESDAVLGGGLSKDERQPDHIHPNHRGGARWASAFWDWLGDHRSLDGRPWALEPFERRGS